VAHVQTQTVTTKRKDKAKNHEHTQEISL